MSKNIVVYSDGTGQDGGVRPEQRVSNVYKMYRSSRVGPETGIDPAAQLAFYDPGLGTDIGSTALTAPVRYLQKLMGSIDGRGITRNIADCYAFIVDHYRPGDRIILIGFSRGAYTVRSIANLLMLCGIPTRAADGTPLPVYGQAIHDIAGEAVDIVLEHGAGFPRARYEAERNEQARRFRVKYGSDHEGGEPGRSNAAPHFIGVFDTVAALGAHGAKRLVTQAILTAVAAVGSLAVAVLAAFPAAALAGALHAVAGTRFWGVFAILETAAVAATIAEVWIKHRRSYRKVIRDFPNKGDVSAHDAIWKGENFDRLLSRDVAYARSANAIDERRADFQRVGWGGHEDGAPLEIAGISRLRQPWFAGNHSDIGGGYDETESRLSDIALNWMVEQATSIPGGLLIDRHPPIGEGATARPKLRSWPDPGGPQHDEVVAMHDAIEAKVPRLLRWATGGWSWPIGVRTVDPDGGELHPSVTARLALAVVDQVGGAGPYRPEPLRRHHLAARYFEAEGAPVGVATPRPPEP
jgi:uncharacterized protein (DUF2235 family)